MGYFIAYAKISENRFDGLILEGIYFGGVAPTMELSEMIARDCASNIKGGTIIPKIFEIMTDDFLDVLDTATQKLETIYENMLQVDMTLTPPKRAKWQKNNGLILDAEAI